MLTNIAIAMSLTLIIITIQCFLLWTFAIQRFRDTTQFECSRQNIVLLVYQNNQFSFACFPFSVALNNWLHQHDTRIHERFWSHTIGCHWTCHFQPTSRSLLGHKGPHKVTSLHGDLSAQKEGHSRHPGWHLQAGVDISVDAVFLVVKTQPSRVRSTESSWPTNGIREISIRSVKFNH